MGRPFPLPAYPAHPACPVPSRPSLRRHTEPSHAGAWKPDAHFDVARPRFLRDQIFNHQLARHADRKLIERGLVGGGGVDGDERAACLFGQRAGRGGPGGSGRSGAPRRAVRAATCLDPAWGPSRLPSRVRPGSVPYITARANRASLQYPVNNVLAALRVRSARCTVVPRPRGPAVEASRPD
jgi:hypothetical protein